MATIQFLVTDGEDRQSVEVECRSTDVDDHDSPANVIAAYLADNWVGLVHAARFAKSQAILQEAASLEREKEIQPAANTPALVDGYGIPMERNQ